MKKLVLFVLILFTVAAFCQSNPFDKKMTLEAAIAKKAELEANGSANTAAAKREYNYVCLLVAFKDKEPATYADLKAYCADGNVDKLMAVWQYGLWRNEKFTVDAVRDIMESKDDAMIVAVLKNRRLLRAGGISLDRACTILMEKVNVRDAVSMNILLDMLADCTLDEEVIKTYLKKTNRALSKELLKNDKAKYEPVIAKIRTLLATF